MRIVIFSLIGGLLLVPCDALAQTTTPGLQIVGRVLDANTRMPIAEVRVSLSGLTRTNPMTPPPQAITDENGVFVFAGLVPGRVRLVANKSGYTPDSTPISLIELTGERPVTKVELVLRRGAVLTGRVLDPRGEPLQGISVLVTRKTAPNNMPGGMAAIPGQTNDLGEFRIIGLMPGEYVLLATSRSPSMMSPQQPVRRSAFAPTFYPGVPNREQAETIVVRSGETIEGLQLHMLSAPAFTVAGVVVDQQGRIVPEAMVSLYFDAGVASAVPSAGARTNADGSFAITGVVAGKYKIGASIIVRSGTSLMTSSGLIADRQDLVVTDADVTGLVIVAPPPR